MTEILNCALCGSHAYKSRGYCKCCNQGCCIIGPNGDTGGEKWNAMQRTIMAGQPKEPPGGAVKVEVLGAIGMSGKWSAYGYSGAERGDLEGVVIDNLSTDDLYNGFSTFTGTFYVIPPKPQEIEGETS